MTQAQAPKVVKKKLFSPIWLLPMIAFALAAWLGIKSVRESGIEIRIHFPSAAGIDVGKTLIKYQGLTMGKVIDMSIDDQLQGVNVDVLMDYRSSPLLKQSTEFWLVTPKASITGIEGLDTLFSGNYISMLPGDGSSRSVFEAEVTAPAMPPGHKGLIINLTTDKLNSLDVGSKVFYRQIPVGQIVGYRLESSQKILMTVFIEQQYADLVKVDSQFWNVSGISVDASLAGIEVRSESLASILAGGVSFSSSTLSEPAKSHHEFNLYPDEKRALGGVDFTLTAKGTESVAINTAIVFRGMNIGRITHKTLTADGVSLAAKIDQQYAHLLAGSSVFWLEGAELSLQGINHPERLLTGSVINFIPGSGPEKQQYALKSEAPEQLDSTKRRLVLHSLTNPGISAGAQLRFKHINIGTVLSARLSPALTEVEYDVEVEADFIRLLTKGSYFVAESALEVNIDLDGIAVKTGDLNTLTSGALNLTQGDSKTLLNNGARLKVFANNRDALQDKEQSQRLHYQLQSHDAADVTQGSPVYFKKMQIGQVEHVQWQANSRDFMIKISIQKAFSSLLSNKAVFWRNSALSINASLSGVEIDVAPLEAAIKGGLSLGLLDVALPSPDHQLYDSQFLALSQSKAISLTFPAGVKLAAKAPIRYLDHQVGEIQAVKLSEDLSMLNVSAYLYGDYATHFN
ncbi:MlaD family protein, partial [Shewanella sp.]|nr:MlaD family protein [Shewanella sp.]